MTPVCVMGVYDPTAPAGEVEARRRVITAHCRREKIAKPVFTTPGFFEATVVACELSQQGNQVILVGDIDDLHVTESNRETCSEPEWRAAWIAYLEDQAIGWSPVRESSTVRSVSQPSRQSVIRSYQRACVLIAASLARIRSRRRIGVRSAELGYVYGRPPYGYRVSGGHLFPDSSRKRVIREAYRLLRVGTPITTTAALLEEFQHKLGSESDPEYWDAVKVRRLISHAPLYCLGQYRSPSGQVRILPSLAILPADWVDVAAPRGAVPKERKSGTLEAETLSTR